MSTPIPPSQTISNTYTSLKAMINDAYATFSSDYIYKRTFGVDELLSNRHMSFVKCIFKVLMNQDGDESIDRLTKLDIQNCISLFNKYSFSIIPIEYV